MPLAPWRAVASTYAVRARDGSPATGYTAGPWHLVPIRGRRTPPWWVLHTPSETLITQCASFPAAVRFVAAAMATGWDWSSPWHPWRVQRSLEAANATVMALERAHPGRSARGLR